MKNTIAFTSVFMAFALLSSCKKNNDQVLGFKPIYAENQNTESVDVRQNETLENPGRIYRYEEYLLINDQSKGIHIYDNSNQNNPQKLSFVAIPGNMDFSVRNNILYADNITDLVMIDISQANQPLFKNRIKNIFPIQRFPDEFGPFECYDPDKGVLIGWEKTMLDNPKCVK